MNSSWKTKKIKELYEYSSGLSKSADQFGFGYPFLSYKDIFHNACVPESLTTLVNSTEAEQKRCSIKRGDVFLTRTSETTDELGMSSVALMDYPSATYNGFTKRLRPTTNEIHPEFAAYFYRSPDFRAQIISMASLITRASLNESNLNRLKITYPNKETQIVIGNILQSYDLIISSNVKKIRLLEKMASELYKEWFVRFRFPGHESVKMVDGVPEGWEQNTIQTYYDTCSGGTPSRKKSEYFEEGIYPWIKTGEINDSIIIDTEEHITQDAVDNSSAKVLPTPSLIMSMYAGENIGRLGYLDTEMTCNQACCVFTDKRSFLSRHYLFHYLKSIREYLLLISFGAAQQNLSQELIKKIKILMPTDDVVMEFEKQVDDIYSNIRILMLENINLTKQRDLLLPRLMSGKLSVEPLLAETA